MDVEIIAQHLLLTAESLGLRAWLENKTHSAYLFIQPAVGTPTTVIRISDHGVVSHRHPVVACNVAPGRSTAADAIIHAAPRMPLFPQVLLRTHIDGRNNSGHRRVGEMVNLLFASEQSYRQ